jgi:predicted nucleic acid-binding protein
MTTVFADTFYFLALLNNTDQAHPKALAFTKAQGRMVTTGWVLTELGDALAFTRHGRMQFGAAVRKLHGDPNIDVRPSDEALFQEGIAFYLQRPDKEWSLTDCISFVVMTRDGITEALTGDHHFEQAGFAALLK